MFHNFKNMPTGTWRENYAKFGTSPGKMPNKMPKRKQVGVELRTLSNVRNSK
jgi:hypothetical protein